MVFGSALRSSEGTKAHTRDRRSLRRLLLEPLESRTLLSASPANAAALAADWSPDDAMQRPLNAQPVAAMVAAIRPSHQDMTVDLGPHGEQQGKILTEAISALESWTNLGANAPIPREQTFLQKQEHLSVPFQYEGVNSSQPVDAPTPRVFAEGGEPFSGDGSIAQALPKRLPGSQLVTSSLPKSMELFQGTESAELASERNGPAGYPSHLLPLATMFVSWQTDGNDPLAMEQAAFFASNRGSEDRVDLRDAPWDSSYPPDHRFDPNDVFATVESLRERMTSLSMNGLPGEHERSAGRGIPGPLVGMELIRDVSTISYSLQNNSIPSEYGNTLNTTIAMSLLPLASDPDEGGFVTLSTGQDVAPISPSLELSYNTINTSSQASDWKGVARLSTDVTLASELEERPHQAFSSLRETMPSTIDDQDGGLIDIDGTAGVVPSGDTPLSRQFRRLNSGWTSLDTDGGVVDGERLPRGDKERRDHSGALADAAFASDWSAESEEGGMIELAAYDSRDSRSPVAVDSASKHVPSKWRDIRIDKGLGRFRAVEVAEAPSEHAGDDALAKQGMEQELPIETTASAESNTPEPSASAATEPHVETDHHAAAPAIIGLSLMSGVDRETRKASSRTRPQKSRTGRHSSE
jgi:hypothetical protein